LEIKGSLDSGVRGIVGKFGNRIKRGGSASFRFCDLHNDVITEISSEKFSGYVRRMKKVGVETILISVWTTNMENPVRELVRCKGLINNIMEYGGQCPRLLLHIEDAWFIDKINIDEIIALKPYSIGITWNDKNKLAGGANSEGKLTSFGKKIIERFVKSNVVVDVAHLNRKSFYEVVDIVKKHGGKLFCTHTCFDEVNPHPRNLDGKQIQTIIDMGGLIGLTLVGDFLNPCGNATMHDVYNHIKYSVQNFGEDNLAIGTDFFGTENLPKGLKKYKDFKRLKKFLIKKGFCQVVIMKIFYVNAKKFFDI